MVNARDILRRRKGGRQEWMGGGSFGTPVPSYANGRADSPVESARPFCVDLRMLVFVLFEEHVFSVAACDNERQ